MNEYQLLQSLYAQKEQSESYPLYRREFKCINRWIRRLEARQISRTVQKRKVG